MVALLMAFDEDYQYVVPSTNGTHVLVGLLQRIFIYGQPLDFLLLFTLDLLLSNLGDFSKDVPAFAIQFG